MLQFICPPLPHFTVGGEDTYPIGGKHASRSNIGVFDLLIVTRGCLFLEEDGQSYAVGPGEYLILMPDRSHRTAMPCREETHFYWVHFQTVGEWFEVSEKLADDGARSGQPYAQIEQFAFYVAKTGALLAQEDVFRKMNELLQLHDDPASGARWRQQQLFHDLLLQLQEEGGRTELAHHLLVAERAAAWLRQRYKESVSYKQLAEALHFHPNYIALCMKKAFGCTPHDYLTRHRIEQAKQLLIHTNEPVGAIAEQTGFGSFPYFVRCFARYAGEKPTAFRRRYRAG
ncbi:AraC family transcriptional regulator [Gordoniibacillus kamchatkensis]|uniref:AraC family transcriptional regulator n=1 Tax=Gordoniibacillus kamchatkensis TaxID=1590651 RepID=A0ABR5AIS5_9BACL|nr:helix-turn-helix transcriptional regulator [Paenibacillus sp. VKM B-2647]KIL40850.1 AraC family transcriptional regulator [Paenibacillus sp. VKM B-2647]